MRGIVSCIRPNHRIRGNGLKRKTLLNGESGHLALMLVLSVATQCVALLKSTVTASAFGASMEMDAYNFSNNIILFLFSFLSSGITAVVIPAYVQKRPGEVTDSFLTFLYLLVFGGTGLIYLFREPLIDLLSNRDAAFRQAAADVMLYTIIIQGVTGILAVTTAYYQCANRYNTPKLILLGCNCLAVVLILLDKNLTIPRYLWFLSLAALINLVLDVGIAIKCGFRYRPAFRFRSPGFRQLLAVFLPCVFSTGVYRIHALVDSLLAASLGEGRLTVLSYANMVVSLVNTIIIGNLTVYAFPKIVARMEDRDERAGQKALWDYSTLFQLAVCLLIAGFFAVGQEGIDLLFLHGKFSRDASRMVYIGSCIYLLGQENNIIRDLVYRYFFGKGNTKATFRNSIVVSCANLVFSLVLVQFLGLYGIILGTVLAGLLSLVMILGKMKKYYGLFPEFRGFLGQYLLSNLIMAVSILAVLALKKILPVLPGPAAIGLYGAATLGIFLLTAFLFRSKALQVRL